MKIFVAMLPLALMLACKGGEEETETETDDTSEADDTSDTSADTSTDPDPVEPSSEDAALAARFCALDYSCYPEEYTNEEECVQNAADGLTYAAGVSEACHDAFVGLNTCLADLADCATLEEYWTEPTETYPCYQWDDAIETGCGG